MITDLEIYCIPVQSLQEYPYLSDNLIKECVYLMLKFSVDGKRAYMPMWISKDFLTDKYFDFNKFFYQSAKDASVVLLSGL